ncbi:MAG: class I SAM-dependent methyltransferase [Chthoniobacterales bacterium]
MSGKSPGPDAVAEELRRRILTGGPIGFDQFMDVALYHPESGYYASDAARTGRRGDFFTSVSVGPVFGRLLAAQAAAVWEALGRPHDFTLVEQGANDGQLMADVLSSLERDCPECRPHAVLVEPLARLRDAQVHTLAAWKDRVAHVDRTSSLPEFTGLFFANELLDAFPFKLLVREDDAWRERRVTVESGGGLRFIEVETDLDAPIVAAEPSRFLTEVIPGLGAWMRDLAGRLAHGQILLIDYGHPANIRHAPARAAGSAAAYRAHQRVDDLLASPGAQDLTAHVDFTAVARAGEQAGLSLAGFTDQYHALASLASAVFPPMAALPPSAESARELRGLRQLLHPESMGTSFKWLALERGLDAPTPAFAFARDPRRELFP